MNEIKKTTLHPDNQPNVDLYPKTSTDQVEGLNNIITGINNEIEKKVNVVDNFVRIFTIPNGASSGKLTADVKEKLCNPDGHNYYVYDDTSEMILKYSFNEENEIIQYKAVYFQINKAYEISMQIFSSNGSWRRSQTVLNVPASAGGKLYRHNITFKDGNVSIGFDFIDSNKLPYTSTTLEIPVDNNVIFFTHANSSGMPDKQGFGYIYSVSNGHCSYVGVYIATGSGSALSALEIETHYGASMSANFTDTVFEV